MRQSANGSFALGHDMLSWPWQIRMGGLGPCLGPESMAPKFNLPPQIDGRTSKVGVGLISTLPRL